MDSANKGWALVDSPVRTTHHSDVWQPASTTNDNRRGHSQSVNSHCYCRHASRHCAPLHTHAHTSHVPATVVERACSTSSADARLP